MKRLSNRFGDFFLSMMSVLKSYEIANLKQPSSKPIVDESVSASSNHSTRPRRRNNAILLMYSGWGYYGMQRLVDNLMRNLFDFLIVNNLLCLYM
ncbi:unnamed protein product [Schistosoma curassoni]|uniref:Flavodoxin-like domain-containing protein n=1 Tax=Schistosoma curassoni TaxID=6186 RepID=A0A183JL10_9TREM|nr:unnamed protein product [Schistosoma curassoni]